MNGMNYSNPAVATATLALTPGEIYLDTAEEFDTSDVVDDYISWENLSGEAVSLLQRETVAEKELRKKFNELAETWKEETKFLSSISDIIIHPAHMQIIAMGPKAVSLILNRLKEETDLWFWALNFITGENPVTQDIRGNVKAMSEAWLEWGRKNGY